MSLTDILVLPEDVLLTPLAQLPRGMRRSLPAVPGGFALGRARVRAPSRVVSADAAALLARFRIPQRIADVIRACGTESNQDPDTLLTDAYPLLRDCHAARFLVPAVSADARCLGPSYLPGDRVAGVLVVRCIAALEDTEVHLARRADGGLCALKVATGREAGRTAAAFRQERSALRRLGGRVSPRLLRSGSARGRPWLLMDWIAGVSPGRVALELRRAGRRAELLQLLTGIARVYARVHEAGVLHGDVHPGNLLVSADGRITLLDFGCARMTGATDGPRGVVLPYAAPEMAAALLQDVPLPPLVPRTEQHAVATMLYELAAGRTHVPGTRDRRRMLESLASGTARPFAAQGVPAWPDLERVLARALARDSAGRFPTMRRFAGALARCSVPPVRPSAIPPARSRADHWLQELAQHAPPDWIRRTRAPRCSVMHGAAGTAFGLYRMAAHRGDAALLTRAVGWWAAARRWHGRRGAFTAPGIGLDHGLVGTVSPFYAGTGPVLVEAHLALASGQLPWLADAVARYCATDWSGELRLDLAQGLAGALLGAAMLGELLPGGPTSVRMDLESMGDALADRLADSCRGVQQFPHGGPLPDAGIAHGWGGVLYAMLRWNRSRGVRPAPATAQALVQLARMAEPRGRGVVFPRSSRTAKGQEISGWCNGPAGLVHLWLLAHEATGHSRYLTLAERCAWSAWEAPDRFPDLCCGLTGRSYALLALHRATGEPAWLDRARELAAAIPRRVGRGTTGRLSLYKGELGAALLTLDLEQPHRACHPFFASEGWPIPAPSSRHG